MPGASQPLARAAGDSHERTRGPGRQSTDRGAWPCPVCSADGHSEFPSPSCKMRPRKPGARLPGEDPVHSHRGIIAHEARLSRQDREARAPAGMSFTRFRPVLMTPLQRALWGTVARTLLREHSCEPARCWARAKLILTASQTQRPQERRRNGCCGAPPTGLWYFQNACSFFFFFQEKPKMSCHRPNSLRWATVFFFFNLGKVNSMPQSVSRPPAPRPPV